jgi:cysteine desulfurase
MSVYLDHLSGSPLDPRVEEAMLPFLHGFYANPISPHKPGRDALVALQQAREKVADFLGAEPGEIIFTSGGIEANNLAVKGLLTVHENGQLLASAVEPMSVLQSAESLERWGYSLALVPVDGNGQVKLAALEKALNKFTRLASVAWVVAETGAVQPVEEIAETVKAAGVPYHCDATHAARLFPINVKELNIDALTICSASLGGPPAVGVLYLRKGSRLQPQIEGGSQEDGRRSGQWNLPGIVGFARAVELTAVERRDRFNSLRALDSYMKAKLQRIPDLILHADLPSRAPGTLSCRINHFEAESLLMSLDREEIYATSGSPCATQAGKPSHILKAMGLTDQEAHASLNFSLSWNTKETEIDAMIAVLEKTVKKYKSMAC